MLRPCTSVRQRTGPVTASAFAPRTPGAFRQTGVSRPGTWLCTQHSDSSSADVFSVGARGEQRQDPSRYNPVFQICRMGTR